MQELCNYLNLLLNELCCNLEHLCYSKTMLTDLLTCLSGVWYNCFEFYCVTYWCCKKFSF